MTAWIFLWEVILIFDSNKFNPSPLIPHICVSESCRRQAIIWTNDGLLLNRPVGNLLYLSQKSNFFIQNNAFENVVCQLAAILSRGEWVNQAISSRC